MSFTVYKSSAGSGKTFILVKEYLKIILNNPYSFRNILAITFTNKAANEMKERILEYLKELSIVDKKENSKAIEALMPEIIEFTGLDENALAERAENVLGILLHNYSDFSISTIDSFIHKIIRTFAYDLHLSVNFDVELDTEKLITKAVDILISNVGNDEKLTEILLKFIEFKTKSETTWHIEKDLGNFAKSLLNEDGQIYISKLRELSFDDFKNIRNKISVFIRKFENALSGCGKEAVDLFEDNGIQISSFYHGNSGIGNYLLKIANSNFSKLEPNIYVRSTIDNDKWCAGKTDEIQSTAINNIKFQLTEIFHKIEKIISDDYKKYSVYKLINKKIYPIAVLIEIEKIFDAIRVENNQVHISEFNKRIAEIVLNEPIPFIYERMGEKYKYFFIDEFQDTSILQWNNLLPLIDNSLSEGNFNMIVGDGKQAIYRWRNGEVEQFDKLPEIFDKSLLPLADERENNLINNYRPEKLKRNFRSKPGIIDFNNQFFEISAGLLTEKYQSIYKDVKQEFDKEKTGGYINICFIDDKDKEKYNEQNFIKIKETILELEDQGFSKGDIAILSRDNKRASKIARYLLEQNIDVISFESLLLSSSPELNLIISILNFLNSPNEKLYKAEILIYLYGKGLIKGTEINEFLSELDNKTVKIDLFNQGRILSFTELLRENGFDLKSSKLNNLPLYDLCEELIRIFELNKNVNPYIQFFLDYVFKFNNEKASNVNDFLASWEDEKNKLSISVPSGINAVNIMTIHKAKGLEFPVVIFPFADQRLQVTKNEIWVDFDDQDIPELKAALLDTKSLKNTAYISQYNEEMAKSFLDIINLLYVVMTRPIERLYILSPAIKKPPKEIKCVQDIFHNFLSEKSLWEANTEEYSFGKTENYIKKEKKNTDNIYKLNSFISNPWRDRVLISTGAPEIWDVDDPVGKSERGNLIHSILAEIITEDNIENVLDDFNLQGIIDKNEKAELSVIIHKLISKPEIKPFFEKGIIVKAEEEILLPDGQKYRPDRVVFINERVIVIDYKTGKKEEKHKHQIDKYADLLLEMGYENVEKYLLYIDELMKF